MDKKTIAKNLEYYNQYFLTMFWADINEDTENYSSDLDIQSIEQNELINIFKELDSFFEKAENILSETNYTHEQACHDFYLTRCGHGCGFWEADHCTKKQGEKLTEIAKEFGPVYITIENNRIYIE